LVWLEFRDVAKGWVFRSFNDGGWGLGGSLVERVLVLVRGLEKAFVWVESLAQ
jgi:hypothetical protein